jgi:NAD(P)-dependent dehydrogenase (short-subunit alcohol dehydrogenase family)
MVAASVEALGGLDVLVNNAGISGQTAPVEDADPDQWEAVMTVDVIGTFHVTRLSIPHLKKSAAGSIVVMSSLGGRFGYPNRSAYCTAKMGLIGLAKTLARELGQYNIRVNAIAPGAVAGDRIELASISARKLSKGTRALSASSGSPLALIASRRLSRSKKPGCPIAFPCAADVGTRQSDLRRARQCYFRGARLLKHAIVTS